MKTYNIKITNSPNNTGLYSETITRDYFLIPKFKLYCLSYYRTGWLQHFPFSS